MEGKQIGYIRVSTLDQNPDRQLEGIQVDKLFTDKRSGQNTDRPQLKALLEFIREGDEIVVHSMDRLARNLEDLRRLVRQCNAKQVSIRFIKENLRFTGEDSPMATLLLSVMGAFAEFERALSKERQLEGITLAKKRGIYRGRKRQFSEKQIAEIQRKAKQQDQNKSQMAKELGISRETLYKYLREESH